MCYKTDKSRDFSTALRSARNDKMRDWNGNECCVRTNLTNAAILIFMRKSSYPFHP
jgi:hypothetical protein